MKTLEEAGVRMLKRQKTSSHSDELQQRLLASLFIPQSASKQHRVPTVLCLHQTNSKIGKQELTGINRLPNSSLTLI
jgi:hypothetical protein